MPGSLKAKNDTGVWVDKPRYYFLKASNNKAGQTACKLLLKGGLMFSVKIAEGENKKTLPYIKSCLKKASREGLIDAALCGGKNVDLLIVPRGVSEVSENAACMLVAGEQKKKKAAREIRCGLSSRDALTLSSINGKSAMLALQTEIYTLEGELLERQEIPVSLEEPAEPEAVLAAAGALLLLGADPERLKF